MSINAYSSTSVLFRSLEVRDEQAESQAMIESFRYVVLRLFSCWHRKMSRPFTRGTRTYRTCSQCGLRRDFDLETWRMKGRYYRDPASKVELISEQAETSHVRKRFRLL